MTRRRIIPFFIPPEACSARCTLCHPTAGRPEVTARALSPEIVSRQIRAEHASQPDASFEVAYYGGLLGRPMTEWRDLLAAAAPGRIEGFLSGIRVASRPDQLSRELLEVLQEHGVTLLELDVPSLSQSVLSQMGPAHSVSFVEAAAEGIARTGLIWGAQLRPGMPGSSLDQELDSLERVIRLAPAFCRIQPVLVLKGTWLERFSQQGRYVPMTLEEAGRTVRVMVDRLVAASIPVIRIGLQPMRDLGLEPGSVVGGPYHPSLRTLVDAERMYDQTARMLQETFFPGHHVILYVAASSESNLRGPENSNLERLRRRFHYASITVASDPSLPKGDVKVEYSRIKSLPRQRYAS